MAPSEKNSADHNEGTPPPDHEAVLTGVIALASLFSTCVEAFGLIHPSHKWDKDEQRLLTRLGLQQARLLVWGYVLGITSPPASVTDRAIPKHPSSAYPDLAEPTFFGARDGRLDEPVIRTTIESTLSAIVDRANHATREEMMAKYGLKPPKRLMTNFEPALDTNRLEAFRERYELLREVAESYAHIDTSSRSSSIVHTSWIVADPSRFSAFIDLTQEKVDFLINSLGIKEEVDRAVRMDIRVFGWHVVMPERARVAADTSKLRLLREICAKDYPEYNIAIEQALANIQRENREFSTPASALQYGRAPAVKHASNGSGASHLHPTQPHHSGEKKGHPGLFKMFRSFGKSKDSSAGQPSSLAVQDADLPVRSKSDAGPVIAPSAYNDEPPSPTAVRSKSVGAWIEPLGEDEQDSGHNYTYHTEQSQPQDLHLAPTSSDPEPRRASAPLVQNIALKGPSASNPDVIRHDQYRGIARTATKDLHQADY